MSDEQDLKLACLHQAGGNLDHAKTLFDWVSGAVRATPESEAPAVSAPNQDKPEQPFNYQHPSKYGTDVPRRCYLEELTPEERAIRDLVGAIEQLGAHPLLTTTVIQLMKAGESLADWIDIGLRDKAIAALSTDLVRTEVVTDGDREDPITSEPETHTGGGRVGVLLETQSPSVDDEVRNQAGDDAPQVQFDDPHALDEIAIRVERDGKFISAFVSELSYITREELEDMAAGSAILKLMLASGVWRLDTFEDVYVNDARKPVAAPQIPEGFIPWVTEFNDDADMLPEGLRADTMVSVLRRDGGRFSGVAEAFWWGNVSDDGISAYRIIQPSAEAERTSDESQAEPVIEQEQKDEGAPVLDALAQADIAMSQPAIEEPEPIQNGDASVFAHGIIREADEPEARRFDLSRLFGKKTVDA